MPARPEIFISATSKDLRSCRQQVRDALLTLGCVPVVQDHFPPGAGEVRAMLRERVAACDAVIHLAGLCYGYEPQERDAQSPRRSYTQLEYDVACELKKPLYTFICSESFPYDAHDPEPDDLRELQVAHRTALTSGDRLYQPIGTPNDLALRVRELQARVEQLGKELQKTRSWLGRGLGAALVVLLIVGVLLVLQHRRAGRTEERAAQSEQKISQLGGELDRYRQAVKLLADRYGQDAGANSKLTPEQKLDHALASVAAEQKVSVGELRTWMDLFVTQVRANPGADFYDRALADFAEQHFADAAANAKKSAEQFRAQRQAAEQVQATAADRAAQAGEKERQGWLLAGDAEFAAGHFAAAIELHEQALALVSEEKNPLVWCETAQKKLLDLINQGKYPEAAPLAQHLVEKRTALLGKEHPDTLRSIFAQASLYIAMANFPAAEPLARACLEARQRLLGKDNPDTLQTATALANLLVGKADFTGAKALLLQCLEIQERTLGVDHPDTLNTCNSLANALYAKGETSDAEGFARRAMEGRERTLGKDHPRTLVSVNNLAIMLSMRGDYTEAEPLFRRALETQERTLGKDHPETLRSLNNLAYLLEKKEDYAAAEPLIRRCLETRERVLGPEHPETLTSVINLARVVESKGDVPAAEALYRRALEAQKRTLGVLHPDTADTMRNLAALLQKKGDNAEAEALYRQVLSEQESTVGKDNPDTLWTLYNLGTLAEARGDAASAEPLYRRAMDGLAAAPASEEAHRLSVKYALSVLLGKQGKREEALTLAREAAEGAAKSLPEKDADRAKYVQHLKTLESEAAQTGKPPIANRR